MKSINNLWMCLLGVVVLGGCASTTVSNRQVDYSGNLARPDHILVYDFVATPGDAPADSGFFGSKAAEPGTPPTAEQVAFGRQVGAEMAAALVEEIRAMGLPAMRASSATQQKINDIVIRGYLLSVNQGSAVERVTIGFGAGSSDLKVGVEGYQVTPTGLRKLGSGDVDAGGGKGPGMAVPAAVMIATANPIGLIVGGGVKVYGEVSGSSKIEGRIKAAAKEIGEALKARFQQQGWIQ